MLNGFSTYKFHFVLDFALEMINMSELHTVAIFHLRS